MFLMKFKNAIWLVFQPFKVPAIEMSVDTPREAVCQVFEKVHQGGVSLTALELTAATFAADEFQLRDDWTAREKRLRDKRPVLDAVDGTSFLTAVTLLASCERHLANKDLLVGCKRADVPRLTLDSFKKHALAVEQGFRKAAELVAPTRLLSLQSRLAAAYKGLAALLMQQGGRDFITGMPTDLHTCFERSVDIHHVFPRKWCEDAKLPREKWNSVVNKAPLAAETNRFVGGDALRPRGCPAGP